MGCWDVRLLMLYDRIKWHYDPHARWQDPDAVRSYLPAGGAARSATPTLWVPDGGYQVHVTDHAEFQRPDPTWHPPPALRGMIIRVSDGVYREPSFATDFRIMDEMLQRGDLDYVMWYHLPSPNVSRQRALDAIAGQLRESGVQWGRPGHGFSIDDEPTPYHDAVTGQAMIDLHNALEDIYQREDLHYVGLYAANYHFIPEQGWPLWGPWPLSNGNMPSWTTNLVMQQWGVADPGGAPGFPNRPVDVNHLFDVATLDRLTGRTDQGEDDLTPEQAAQLDALFHAATDLSDGSPRWAQQEARVNVLYDAATGLTSEGDPRWMVQEARVNDTWQKVSSIKNAVDAHTAHTVDVDALAKALAPLLNSGADAHTVALEVADVLGDRLSGGGTEGGSK